jgi:hypothetical protein
MESAANEQFAAFPRALRSSLHAQILADPESLFREGPDDTWTGRGFAIALGEYPSPLSQCTLTQLLDCLGLNPDVRLNLVATFARWMTVLHPSPVVEETAEDPV